MKRLLPAVLLLAAAASAQEIRMTQIASGIPDPTDIQSANDGTGRLFFIQQNGIVRIFRDGALVTQPFLDIRNKTRGTGERGLLGLAFPPGFAGSQQFYVDYTDLNGDTIIARYRVSPNPDIADAASEIVLLKIPQPFDNHNGGQIRFGPDGYLYIAMGDGGSGGDPMGNGQNRNVLLGKLLRIAAGNSFPGRISIPPDNPFVNSIGADPQVWAFGLRNPWRFSFDRVTRDLWIADVGQDLWEEIDFQPASSRGGENYGWNVMEGAHCFRPANCTMAGLVLPAWEYGHDQGCSVIGGFVYRGRGIPGLRGTYIYADYCSGRVWGLTRQGSGWSNRLLASTNFNITTFGEDEAGEIYAGNGANGAVYRIDGGRAPRLTASAVVNAASFVAGLTPGSLATAFAAGVLDDPGTVGASSIPLPKTLAGVSVTVGGIAAPILALANVNGLEQVNFQVPFEMRGRTSAAVAVTRDGQSSASVDVPVFDVQPGVYSGVVVHNQDFTLASADRPLVAGEFAFVYAAGLGRVTNEPATGSGAPASPLASATGVQITIAGLPCDVQFAGLAPGFVGVYQLNFRVPPNSPSGLQDLVVSAGGLSSPVVRVPVR